MNHVDAQLFDLQPVVRRSHFLATQSAILPSLPRLTMSMVCVGLNSSLHSSCWPLLRPAPKQRVRTTPMGLATATGLGTRSFIAAGRGSEGSVISTTSTAIAVSTFMVGITAKGGAMWTLVIIVVMSSVQGGSGTSNSIHSVGNFSSQDRCDAAAKSIAYAGVVQGTLQSNGVYEIRTHCVGL